MVRGTSPSSHKILFSKTCIPSLGVTQPRIQWLLEKKRRNMKLTTALHLALRLKISSPIRCSCLHRINLLSFYFLILAVQSSYIVRSKFIPLFVDGPGSSVGTATGYRLDGPGIESRWGRDFPDLSRPALGPKQPPVQSVPGLSWG
jgi:hypothetical protein